MLFYDFVSKELKDTAVALERRACLVAVCRPSPPEAAVRRPIYSSNGDRHLYFSMGFYSTGKTPGWPSISYPMLKECLIT
jgi:hypothetical protein